MHGSKKLLHRRWQRLKRRQLTRELIHRRHFFIARAFKTGQRSDGER
jgi:hypothetical protein